MIVSFRWQNFRSSPLSPVEGVVDLGPVHFGISDVASQAGQELVHIADSAGALREKADDLQPESSCAKDEHRLTHPCTGPSGFP